MDTHEDVPRIARLSATLTFLQSKRLITASELAEKFCVSVRTVYRDIRTLEQAGIPICTEEGKGYSLVEGFTLPPVAFTEAEANALITAEHIIRKNKDASLISNYQTALTKIKAAMRYSMKDSVDLLTNRIVVRQNPHHDTTSNYLSPLQAAITGYKVVAITYQSLHDNVISERTIEPLAVYTTQENWILIAWCRTRHDYRSFRLDKILRLAISEERYAPRTFNLQEYFEECRKKSCTPDTQLSVNKDNFASINSLMHTLSGETFMAPSTETQTVQPFFIVGIAVRTTNEQGQATRDIPALWGRFFAENIAATIPNTLDQSVFCVYTDYEGDHTKPYTTVLGLKVSNLDIVPAGMKGVICGGGKHQKFTAKGSLNQGVVFGEWTKIWNSNLPRTFTADFEVYGEKAANPDDAEVDIFIAVK
jgi:predicted DNA-binding transcriptional regulator YafY/predicted transcriptional regulator YdeE